MKNWDEFEALIDEANEFFENCLFKEAKEVLEEIEEEFPGEPETAFALALILEREPKEAEQAKKLFQFAYEKDPETFHLPLKISKEELEKIADDVINEIKAPFQKELKKLPIFIEELPSEEDLTINDDEEILPPSIWGLFKGRNAAEDNDQGASGRVTPPQIIIYRRNLCRDCENLKELRSELKITILHEVAHYFGLSEEDVEKLGL